VKAIKYAIVASLELACSILDHIPSVERDEEGKWHYYSNACWPHRFRVLTLSKHSMVLDERWKTGYWGKAASNE